MAKYMRQVTQDEYEILTRFHPGEVRYYIDTKTWGTRRKGATVQVGGSAAKKSRRKPIRAVSGRGRSSNGRAKNSPMQIISTAHEFKEGSLSKSLMRLVNRQFHNDPTRIVGRTDLVENIVTTSNFGKNQVGPFVSDCVKKGILKYKEQVATQ